MQSWSRNRAKRSAEQRIRTGRKHFQRLIRPFYEYLHKMSKGLAREI